MQRSGPFASVGRLCIQLLFEVSWRRPITLLNVGLAVGFCWALLFNGGLGARLGVFAYGRVIPGLAALLIDRNPDSNPPADLGAKVTAKLVDLLNRRNYIRNLVRDVNAALEA